MEFLINFLIESNSLDPELSKTIFGLSVRPIFDEIGYVVHKFFDLGWDILILDQLFCYNFSCSRSFWMILFFPESRDQGH